MKKIFIWLDNNRSCHCPKELVSEVIQLHCLSYEDAIAIIEKYKDEYEFYIDFNYNLGYNKKTGYDLAQYLIENKIKCKYRVHGLNFSGKKNIEYLLDNYNYLKS